MFVFHQKKELEFVADQKMILATIASTSASVTCLVPLRGDLKIVAVNVGPTTRTNSILVNDWLAILEKVP